MYLKPIPHTVVCLRIANARFDFDTQVKEADPLEGQRPDYYDLPEIHDVAYEQPEVVAEADQAEESDEELEEDEADQEVGDEVGAEKAYAAEGLILKLHHITSYVPRSETYLNCQLLHGPNVAQTYEHIDCQYKTKSYDYQFVKDTPGY